MKITELPPTSYVYRYKPVLFWGKGESAPQRKDDKLDEWDKVFNSKEEYEKWYKDLIAGLAELDEVMNYCKYFKRSKGNEGFYERENKSCPVNGTWTGYYLNTPMMADFKSFLKENSWINNWFELMDKYKS